MTRLPKALRGGRARRVLVVAAVFAAVFVTVASGGARLVLGRVAAVGAEHAHVGTSLHQEGDGVDGPWRAGDADNP